MNRGNVIALMLASAILSVTTFGASAESWIEGLEKDTFGHTFQETSWYSTVNATTEKNETAQFGISFLNLGEVQAFLITLNHVQDNQSNVGVLPYQMFGMHYFTSEGQEVFVGALLAFLAVFEDKDGNNIPGQSEKFFYVIPFGAGKVVNGTYPPTVTNMGVKKISDDHYQMGITFRNMYAVASENPLLSAYLATGWVLQFSELSVIYDIRFDRDSGTVSAETYYEIGQITTLYAVLLGIPFISQNIQETIPDNYGIGAVHFTTVFTSNFRVVDEGTGSALDTNRDQVVNGTVDIRTGDRRAFSVGLRGDYALLDERNGTMIAEDKDAYNMIMKAKVNDLLLVAWQLEFSANVFSAMAFGLSHQVRSHFGSADDLEKASKTPGAAGGFGSQAFWYGVFFPGWEGYRVVHDPVYTAYFGSIPDVIEDIAKNTPGFELSLILSSSLIVATVAVISAHRTRKGPK